MEEECLICKAPLVYLEADVLMECTICHKKDNSKTRCINGHCILYPFGGGQSREVKLPHTLRH